MTNLNINFKKMLKETKFNAARIIIVGFLCVIIVGTLMLMLPISSAKGQWTDFVTALFTATTSTCVTGLVVVPTYAYWSLFGKVVILILIQLGGAWNYQHSHRRINYNRQKNKLKRKTINSGVIQS